MSLIGCEWGMFIGNDTVTYFVCLAGYSRYRSIRAYEFPIDRAMRRIAALISALYTEIYLAVAEKIRHIIRI